MKEQKINIKDKIVMAAAIIVIIVIAVLLIINKPEKKVVENKIEGFAGAKTMQALSDATTCPLPKNNNYDEFAKCLTEKGAVMYGAEWCTHCKEQKAAFGDSFKYIKYIECPENILLCTDKGINGYPTWIIGTSTGSKK